MIQAKGARQYRQLEMRRQLAEATVAPPPPAPVKATTRGFASRGRAHLAQAWLWLRLAYGSR